jgi:FkbM family methyltransferase
VSDRDRVQPSMTRSKKSALLHWANDSLRAVLPWPVVAWCEDLYFTQFGEIELRMVRHLCRTDRDSIDVGANIGVYLHAMKRHSRQVYAFEPIPWLAQSLASKFGPAIVVKRIALSRETGTALLHIPVIDGSPVTGLSALSGNLAVKHLPCWHIGVETRSLDDVYFGNVGFIKIDVEGHEESVLQGAQRTIAHYRPRVLVEAEERHRPGSVRRLQAFFRPLDYHGYFVLHRRLVPIERFDPERMQRIEDIADYTLGTPRTRFERYINNFLFLPPDEPTATLALLDAALTKPAGA